MSKPSLVSRMEHGLGIRWNGRFPETAFHGLAVAFLLRPLARLIPGLGMFIYVFLIVVGKADAGWIVLAVAVLASWITSFVVYKFSVGSARQVCAMYGIPSKAARRMPLKHPAKFDAWLMKHYGLESHRSSQE